MPIAPITICIVKTSFAFAGASYHGICKCAVFYFGWRLRVCKDLEESFYQRILDSFLIS